MYFFIYLFTIFLFHETLLGVTSRQQEYARSRTVVLASKASQSITKVVQKNDQKLQFILKNQEEYVLVPKKLIGDKLARYFSETSSSVIAMSCCPKIQVHRRCLRDMFHAKEHNCSDKCPGCCKSVTRHIFAQSRSNYLLSNSRKSICDYCQISLKN